MNALLALMLQDCKRLLSNALFWVISVTLLAIVLLVNFALPKSLLPETARIVTFQTTPKIPAEPLQNEAELYRLVAEERAIGLIGAPDGSIRVVHSGISEKIVRALILQAYAQEADLELSVVTLAADKGEIPFNLRVLPMFICFEALVIGFILGGALLLAEKECGVIRALRISPMGVDRYMLAKTLLFSLIGIVYAGLMVVFCIGLQVAWLPFVLLSFLGAALFALLGLVFAAPFRDMNSWFFSMAVLLSLNMLPAAAYAAPSFFPRWLRFIPSYALISAYEKILFDIGESIVPAVLNVSVWCVCIYLIGRVWLNKILFRRQKVFV